VHDRAQRCDVEQRRGRCHDPSTLHRAREGGQSRAKPASSCPRGQLRQLTAPRPVTSVRRMSLHIERYEDADRAMLDALIRDPTLAREFDSLAEAEYLDRKLGDSYCDREATRIARMDGEPAGFCITYLLPRA